MSDGKDCTCGSGMHPRRCVKHPLAYELHVAELNLEITSDNLALAEKWAALWKALAKRQRSLIQTFHAQLRDDTASLDALRADLAAARAECERLRTELIETEDALSHAQTKGAAFAREGQALARHIVDMDKDAAVSFRVHCDVASERDALRALVGELVGALDDPGNHYDSGDTWDGDNERCPASTHGEYSTGLRGDCNCSIGPLIARARAAIGEGAG